MDEEVLMAASAAREVPKRATIERERGPADDFDRVVQRAFLLLIGAAVVLAGGIVALVALLR